MRRSVDLGRFLGIEVDLHYSWFFIVALLASGLAQGFFPEYFPGLSVLEYWIMGVIASILLFVSVLLHEMSHSIVAMRNKIKVEKITLFFFGGVASIREKGLTPSIELKMSIAGPVFSICLGALFWAILMVAKNVHVVAIAYYLFRINIILAAFNFVPGYPLDGGRVFRALLWGMTGDIKKATRYASNLGRYFGMFLMILGGLAVFSGNFGGLWFVFLGGFLYFLAKISYEQTVLKDVLDKLKVMRFLETKYRTVDALMPLDRFINDYILKYLQPSYPVLLKNKFVGVAGLANAEMAPKQQWRRLRIVDVMTPAKKVGRINVDASAYKALSDMMGRNVMMLPVVKGEKFIGIVTKSALMHFARVKLEIAGERAVVR